jgi:uncharacterized membrane protein
MTDATDPAPARTPPAATPPAPPAGRPRRLAAVDAARGIAIVMMVVYHFAWDLTFFDLADIDLFGDPVWLAFRAVILSSFLAIAGVAQALAAARGLDPRRWARRLAVLAAAAGLVTLTTWLPLGLGFAPALGERFIWFGVLHHLALASLIGLAAVRLPWPAVAALAAAALALDALVAVPAMDARWVIWLGLGTYMPATNDWVPVFPWIGVYLAGLAVGQALAAPIARLPDAANPVWRALARAGRWSLPIYLLHQPVLIGALAAIVFAFGLGGAVGPGPGTTEREQRLTNFTVSCISACETGGLSVDQCRRYCACMVDGLESEGLLDRALADALTETDQPTIDRLVKECRP